MELHHLEVGKQWCFVNALNKDVERTFSLVNDILTQIEKGHGIKLKLGDLAKISKTPKFIMSLIRGDANYGGFEFDEGHDG